MDSRCWIIAFAWITMFGVLVGGSKNDSQTIWCIYDDVKENPNLLKMVGEQNANCEAERTKEYPFTLDSKQRTPMQPRNIHTEFMTYKTMDVNQTTQIAVIVTWEYKAEELGVVEKYHIELNIFHEMGHIAKQYMINWDRDKTSDASGLVKFGFIYSGKPGNYHIYPEDSFSFKVQATPIYCEACNPQVAAQEIKIPNCTNSKISKTERCVKARKQKEKQKRRKKKRKEEEKKQSKVAHPVEEDPTIPVQEKEFDSTTMVLLLFGVLVLIIVFLTLFWCCRERIKACFFKLKSQDGGASEQKRVVFVCSLNKIFLSPINQFINLFTKFTDIEITCNLRQSNEIGEQGIPDWMKKTVRNADMVVFLVADANELKSIECEESDERSTDQVSMALKAAEKMIFAADYERKKFVVIDLNDCTKKEDLAYFTRFKFPRDFDKFAKLLVGDVTRIGRREKEIFLPSLKIATLGGYNGEIEPEEGTQVRINVENLNELSNNDEEERNVLMEEEESTRNIVTESQPPSVESNRGESYLTTDFNVDQSERYNQAGARPKVRV